MHQLQKFTATLTRLSLVLLGSAALLMGTPVSAGALILDGVVDSKGNYCPASTQSCRSVKLPVLSKPIVRMNVNHSQNILQVCFPTTIGNVSGSWTAQLLEQYGNGGSASSVTGYDMDTLNFAYAKINADGQVTSQLPTVLVETTTDDSNWTCADDRVGQYSVWSLGTAWTLGAVVTE